MRCSFFKMAARPTLRPTRATWVAAAAAATSGSFHMQMHTKKMIRESSCGFSQAEFCTGFFDVVFSDDFHTGRARFALCQIT
jgi:hypothetical protein